MCLDYLPLIEASVMYVYFCLVALGLSLELIRGFVSFQLKKFGQKSHLRHGCHKIFHWDGLNVAKSILVSNPFKVFFKLLTFNF